jgi:hypothetical protein
MQSTISLAICGKQTTSDIVCLRFGGQFAGEIKTNSKRNIKRSVNQKSNHAFFGFSLLYPHIRIYAMTEGFRFESPTEENLDLPFL